MQRLPFYPFVVIQFRLKSFKFLTFLHLYLASSKHRYYTINQHNTNTCNTHNNKYNITQHIFCLKYVFKGLISMHYFTAYIAAFTTHLWVQKEITLTAITDDTIQEHTHLPCKLHSSWRLTTQQPYLLF
mgnify:CR=1 FL=1